MRFAAMLVHVDAGTATAVRLARAVALAESFHSSLIGLLSISTNESGWVLRHADGTREYQSFASSLADDCEQSRQSFDAATEAATFPVDWRVGEGTPEEALQCEGRLADLVIVGQPREPGPGDRMTFRQARRLVASTIIGVGRPVLVIPPDVPTPSIGTRVMIGWNGSRESARAILDALPWLERAQSVDVVHCVRSDGHRDLHSSPGAYAVSWLARRGIHASLTELLTEPSADIGHLLLDFARRRGVDLIVCGAYGKGHVREEVLGGVTDTLLREMPAATLLCH